MTKKSIRWNLVVYTTWDAKNSLKHPTDISPKSNYANALKFATTFIKNLSLEVQYALSIIQEQIPHRNEDNSLDYLLSSSKSRAFDARLNYLIGKANVGIVYENIDPTYRTFGAMYFNNDLENISLTFARPFFKDHISIATQLGYQRDNLKEQKNQTSVRTGRKCKPECKGFRKTKCIRLIL